MIVASLPLVDLNRLTENCKTASAATAHRRVVPADAPIQDAGRCFHVPTIRAQPFCWLGHSLRRQEAVLHADVFLRFLQHLFTWEAETPTALAHFLSHLYPPPGSFMLREWLQWRHLLADTFVLIATTVQMSGRGGVHQLWEYDPGKMGRVLSLSRNRGCA